MATTQALKAVFLLGTLKKKQVLSHTDALCEVVAETLQKQENVTSELIRLRDYDIQPGTKRISRAFSKAIRIRTRRK